MPIASPTIPGIHGYGLLSARPTAGQLGAHYYATDTLLFYRDNGTTWDTMPIAASGVSLTNSSNYLASDVAMTTLNTYYDGPTLTLAAGTWLLSAAITTIAPASSFTTAKLWDGTTVTSSGETFTTTGSAGAQLSLVGIVTPGSSTAYKVSVANNVGGGTLKAAANVNGAGNNASFLIALKIG